MTDILSTATPTDHLVGLQTVSLKGGVIYRPKGEAGEYAELASSPYRSCGNWCLYCYVPKIPSQPDPKTFHKGAVPRENYLERLRIDARKLQAKGITKQVFLTFTSDLYNPFNTSLTRPTLEILIEHGLSFCVLTKGGRRSLVDLDLYRPDRDAYAATLTSLDDEFSLKWERRAALPGDRIAALRTFHESGIYTWVSLEPTLDVEASLAIVAATHGFINRYKIGMANYVQEITRTTDWRDYTLRMLDLLQKVGADFYFKKNLQPYLPPDIHNPMHVPQHH